MLQKLKMVDQILMSSKTRNSDLKQKQVVKAKRTCEISATGTDFFIHLLKSCRGGRLVPAVIYMVTLGNAQVVDDWVTF